MVLGVSSRSPNRILPEISEEVIRNPSSALSPLWGLARREKQGIGRRGGLQVYPGVDHQGMLGGSWITRVDFENGQGRASDEA